MMHRMLNRSWLVVVPTVLLLILALGLTSTSKAAPAAGMVNPQAQTPETPVCATCHAQEETEWQASPHAKAGATCESCHGAYKEGHPAGETMTLPMESETCQTCHTDAFNQWEASAHTVVGVDCFDCHKAHTQGLRIEPLEKLCSACHTKEETQLAHGIHGISGIACASCHMSQQLKADAKDSTDKISNHTFTVASDVCARCHTNAIHGAESATKATTETQAETEAAALERQDRRVAELEQQVMDSSQQVERLQNLAIIGMGLALGVGGMVGLVIGVAVMTLISRRKQS